MPIEVFGRLASDETSIALLRRSETLGAIVPQGVVSDDDEYDGIQLLGI